MYNSIGRIMLRFGIVFFCFVFSTAMAMQKREPLQTPSSRTLYYTDAQRERPVVVELWYLTDLGEKARDASFSLQEGKRPLILMSHGHRGWRGESSWLAERLAKKGYIVAALDHHGDMRSHFDALISLRFWERCTDFKFILDTLEKDASLRGVIDFERVGFVGYSLGGMTGLSLAGAVAQNAKSAVSKIAGYPVEKGLSETFDFSHAEKNYKEPRIKAMLLLCPAVFIYSPKALRQIKIPVGLVVSVDDEVLPFEEHAAPLIEYITPFKLKVCRENVSHYAFKDPSILNSLHQDVSVFAEAFFRETLAEKEVRVLR